MAIGVKIDFKRIYNLNHLSVDLRQADFISPLKDGSEALIRIEISNESHELLHNVFNLAFGPLNLKGDIDDKVELTHQDYSRVFSTILLTALNYLTLNPQQYLGVDGSDNNRAYYYWRFLQRNLEYLKNYFDIYGLKYYVRISRFGKTQYENPFNFEDIIPSLDSVSKTHTYPAFMYNYFIFKLK